VQIVIGDDELGLLLRVEKEDKTVNDYYVGWSFEVWNIL
jgi:hypothetical protein